MATATKTGFIVKATNVPHHKEAVYYGKQFFSVLEDAHVFPRQQDALAIVNKHKKSPYYAIVTFEILPATRTTVIG